jgi:hypothetical protein
VCRSEPNQQTVSASSGSEHDSRAKKMFRISSDVGRAQRESNDPALRCDQITENVYEVKNSTGATLISREKSCANRRENP